jgi:hypothetical protein
MDNNIDYKNYNDIYKIKNEIEKLMNSIEIKEKELTTINNNNNKNIKIYKSFLEDMIMEYHNVCKKIYTS